MSTSGRRVGLSKNANGPSLLSTYRNRKSEVRPIDAPPESSSSDEAEEKNASDSSDAGLAGRGNITSTNFMSKSRGRPATAASRVGGGKERSNGVQRSAASSKDGNRKRGSPSYEDQDELSEPSRPSKKSKPATTPQSSLGSHLEDEPFNSQSKGARSRYGVKKYSSSQSSQGRREEPKEPKSKFKVPRAATPDDLSPRKTFIKHDEARRRPMASPSPVKAFKMPTATVVLSSEDSSKEALPRKKMLQKRKKQSSQLTALDVDDMDAGVSQRAVFIIPEDITVDLEEPTDEPSAKEKDPDEAMGPESTEPVETTVPESVCPMCSKPVDGALLKQFSKQARMNIDQQMRFCALHRKKEARETWVSKGYPDIDWTTFDRRIASHHQFLKGVLEGEKCYFRDALDDKVRQGKGRTLKKSDDKMTPGYYGPRGLRVMSESIVKDFSSLLRKRAVEDSLVSARGYTSYVQMVMVPELAVHLIMEDMDVGRDEARNILFDSCTVGELVNEDIADVVLRDRGSDTDESSALSEVESDDEFPL